MRDVDYWISLARELIALPHETTWVELKHNNSDPQAVGEYISALANAAALDGKAHAYMIWGVDDDSHKVVGTSFDPASKRVGGEELESWLLRQLAPKIDFAFHAVMVDERPLVVLEIGRAFRHPVQFANIDYVRIGTYKKKLKDFPEKERLLWRTLDATPYEWLPAVENIGADEVLALIDYPAYFDMLGIPLPEGREGILHSLAADHLIERQHGGTWHVRNLGAILFARKLSDFGKLARKAVRVVFYDGVNRAAESREVPGNRGYAAGFERLIRYINDSLPSNDAMGQALRTRTAIYPELAVRELVANALIHQDFSVTGSGPLIEIFKDRMEVTNPGIPLVDLARLLDHPPRSRNESLASLMRRAGICEERGSGVDKVVIQTELHQLPAPAFEIVGDSTRSVLFAPQVLSKMDSQDRIRAVYLHASLRYVQRDFMTNQSLRERFAIDPENSATASRLLREALEAGKIRIYDETVGQKSRKYLPNWA